MMHQEISNPDRPAEREHAWHAKSPGDCVEALNSDESGLSQTEVNRRRQLYGANVLPEADPKSLLARFVAQLNNLLIYVLLAAALVTALLGEAVDTAVILAVVVINAVIGLVQEGRAERALDALRGMMAPVANVVRDGARVQVAADKVVPGDILLLEAGDRVCADTRLLKARSLRIDEAVLTGESVAVNKSAGVVDARAALGDRSCMTFSGTMVTAGSGSGVVVATGPRSEIGRITGLLGQVQKLTTPLIVKMNEFAQQLSLAILGLCSATVLYAIAVRDFAVSDAFLAVVAMAVAAIPEGLPAVMTITLAIGVARMAERNAIIRRLPAVETLGAVSTICTDKTGTLTRNEMMVARVALADTVYEVTGTGYEPKGDIKSSHDAVAQNDAAGRADPTLDTFARGGVLCNDAELKQTSNAWQALGDPMEAALLTLAHKVGVEVKTCRNSCRRLDTIPFDATYRYMATLNSEGTDAIATVKGAPEAVIAMCNCVLTNDGETAIDAARWHQIVDEFAQDGLRTLAIARKTLTQDKNEISHDDIAEGLCLVGIGGFIDPPRKAAKQAIAMCQSSGIDIKMITGDHGVTAQAIATQLGIDVRHDAVSGADLDTRNAAEFAQVAGEASVFARTSPEHKLRLVEALQAVGKIVAMTGDGVNDAPALKRADVGVAMGRKGTEAAKEASDMVLADDNFASIIAAVREGRTVYDNLTKVISWTLPTSFGETVIIAVAILLGLALPIMPLQILWINMVTAAGLGVILAFEPPEADVMTRPPRDPTEGLLTRALMWQVAFVSALFVAGAFAVYAYCLSRGLSVEAARTIVVNTIVAMEIFYLFNIRFLRSASLTLSGIKGTPAVLIGIASVMAAQLAFTYAPPLQAVFDTRAIGLADLCLAAGVGALLFAVVEVEKRLRQPVYRRLKALIERP